MTVLAINGVTAGFAVQHLERYGIATPPVVSLSREQTVSNGSQILFDIPFAYISSTHVHVYVGAIEVLYPNWSFVSPVQIQLAVPATTGVLVEVRRQTPLTPLVTYTDGAVLTGEDLNLATLQNLYLVQEWQDLYGAALNGALTQVAGYNGPVTVSPAELIAAVADQVLSSALVISLQSRIDDIDLNAQALLAQSTVIDGIQGIIDSLTGVGGIGTIIATETASRITGDSALQSQLTLLGAYNGTQTAFIISQATAFVDATTSLGTYITNQTANFAAATTALNTEATTRATADTALSSLITALTSNLGTTNATLTTEQSTRATADTALASSITTLSGTVAGNSAAISTNLTAQVAGDTANASAITTLTTTVNGNTTAIATNATVVSGLSAQYTVKVDVNGRVSGYGLASTATTAGALSSFVVIANEFSVVDPGNTLASPIVPFAISGGVCFMNSVVINGALIQNATITNAQIANLTVGTAQMAANSITNISTNTAPGSVVVGAGTGVLSNVDMVSVTVTTTGAQVEIDVGCIALVAGGTGGTGSVCNLSVYRDGSQVTNGMVFDLGATSAAVPFVGQVTLTVLDTPAAGSHTYTLHGQFTKSSAAAMSMSCKNNFIKVMEIKK